MKRKFGAVVAGVAAAGVAMLGTTPASATPVPGFNVKNIATGKCLRFNGIGHPVTAETCNVEVQQQRWAMHPDGIISVAAGTPTMGPCLLAKKGGGGDVYVNSCNFSGWSSAFVVSSFHNKEKALWANPGAGCYLKVSGSNAVCTPGQDGRQWWMAIYG
ncbi:ricin-type beta-trefoil lectin domain protein [Streptomyces noursei]|uniref:ricin-type beta-trefoil lectin domain protein n=1 Tax=Streptomyces noursei TaxID=1971 RepID=UPI00081CDC20|nr:putative carbohydrate-binding protein [Streptomyces noursei ATCC 11455]MCZ0993560.1 ricin-type beta-trefoil lectin domain protein [Streptomyces noursei]